MKLVVAIVHPEDAGALVDALTDKDFRVTRLHSQGGFLKQSHATILAGVEEAQVDDVIATIRETCHARSQFINPMPPIMEPGEFYMPYPVEVTFGGATVFVLDVARYERIWRKPPAPSITALSREARGLAIAGDVPTR